MISVGMWIAGIILFLGGLAGYLFCKWFQPLHEAEVKGMKAPDGGKFEGEPDYMKTFREGRAEGELMDNSRRIDIFKKTAIVGGVILAVMFFLLFI